MNGQYISLEIVHNLLDRVVNSFLLFVLTTLPFLNELHNCNKWFVLIKNFSLFFNSCNNNFQVFEVFLLLTFTLFFHLSRPLLILLSLWLPLRLLIWIIPVFFLELSLLLLFSIIIFFLFLFWLFWFRILYFIFFLLFFFLLNRFTLFGIFIHQWIYFFCHILFLFRFHYFFLHKFHCFMCVFLWGNFFFFLLLLFTSWLFRFLPFFVSFKSPYLHPLDFTLMKSSIEPIDLYFIRKVRTLNSSSSFFLPLISNEHPLEYLFFLFPLHSLCIRYKYSLVTKIKYDESSP